MAEHSNECATAKMQEQFKKKAQLYNFAPDQWVFLREYLNVGKTAKLSPNWSGPYKIVKILRKHNLIINRGRENKTEK